MAFQEELLEWKNKYGTQIAVEEMIGVCKSYEVLYDDALRYASWFRKQEQERIALLGATSYAWLCHAYGALMAGKTVIVADPLLPVADIVSLLSYTDVELVYTDDDDKKLRNGIEEAGIAYEMFIELSECVSDEECTFEKDGDIIFFTSGTSGRAKGVVLPFEAVYGNAQRLSESTAVGLDGKMYTPLPFYHIYATTMTLAFLHKGQTVCLGNPRHVLQELEYFKPAIMVMVSAMAEFLLKNKAIGEWGRLFAVAGAKCDKSLELSAAECGIQVQNLYGASETAGGIGLSCMGQGIERMAAAKGVNVSVEPDGEIVIQTLGHMKEYYKNPQATAEVMRDGKIYLGDVGEAYEDGTFSPMGRKQDVIAMKNGNKLYCDEMDEELTAVDGVEEACVIYVDGKVIAVVVCEDGCEEDVVRKNLKQYNKKQPYFRKLDEIWMRKEALPRTRIGKLQRNHVIKEYGGY
ncbi:MAG: acyl--CoA ligase [Lachnospiraceae bacterium]|nr:acyl--CoA ligase [Lachnospiraceae bacterium]